MKSLKQQWTNLFCQESEDDFISKLNYSGNLNMNKDLFDISSEVCFANRFPSFDEQKIIKNPFLMIHCLKLKINEELWIAYQKLIVN